MDHIDSFDIDESFHTQMRWKLIEAIIDNTPMSVNVLLRDEKVIKAFDEYDQFMKKAGNSGR